MTRAASVVATLAMLPLAACSGVSKLDWALGRDAWQKPEAVVEALAIEPGQRVADLGTGESAYFVPYLSEAVGARGRVYAVDVEPEITEPLAKRYSGDPVVEVVLGSYDDPALPDGAIDRVLVVNTFHHIEDRSAYFERLRRDLAPGGRVAVLEPNEELGGILSLFLDEGHTSRADEVAAEMAAAGYRLAHQHAFLPVQIFLVFEPDAMDGAGPLDGAGRTDATGAVVTAGATHAADPADPDDPDATNLSTDHRDPADVDVLAAPAADRAQ